MLYANSKGADQPVYLCSLISTFVVRCPDSIIPLLATAKISRHELVAVAEQASLSLTWSQTLKTGFLVTWLRYQVDALFLLGDIRYTSWRTIRDWPYDFYRGGGGGGDVFWGLEIFSLVARSCDPVILFIWSHSECVTIIKEILVKFGPRNFFGKSSQPQPPHKKQMWLTSQICQIYHAAKK